jgi:hypothetical protein
LIEGKAHMAILPNARREKFEQELAKGNSASEAMREAGYSDPRNSTRLTKNDEIRKRVLELQFDGAVRAEVTIASLVDELEQARALAMAKGQAGAAVAATMGKAKITGLAVERAEIGQPGDFAGARSIEEIVERIRAELGSADADAFAALVNGQAYSKN